MFSIRKKREQALASYYIEQEGRHDMVRMQKSKKICDLAYEFYEFNGFHPTHIYMSFDDVTYFTSFPSINAGKKIHGMHVIEQEGPLMVTSIGAEY